MNQSSFGLHLSVKIFFKVPILGNCAGILSLIFASLLHCYEKIGLINQTSNLGSLLFRLYGRFCLQQNDSCTKCLTDATKLIFRLLKFKSKQSLRAVFSFIHKKGFLIQKLLALIDFYFISKVFVLERI